VSAPTLHKVEGPLISRRVMLITSYIFENHSRAPQLARLSLARGCVDALNQPHSPDAETVIPPP